MAAPAVRTVKFLPAWRQRQLAHIIALHALSSEPRCVLYGATAINLYLDPAFWIDTLDLDVLCEASTDAEFNELVANMELALHQSLGELHMEEQFWDCRITVKCSAVLAGCPRTVKLYIGALHVMDLSWHTAAQVKAIEQRYPRERAHVVTSAFSPFDITVCSLNELLHRMACTVRNVPCADGLFVDALSPDDALHAYQQQRVRKDSMRLDRITLLHAMGRGYVRWSPRTWVVADVVTVTHDDSYLLRTPLLIHADLGAFPDVAAIESSLVILPQRDAVKLRDDSVQLRAAVAALRAELTELKHATADALCTYAALPTGLLHDVEARHRKLIADMRAEVQTCKQMVATLTRQLEKVKAAKTERASVADRKLQDRESAWKQRLEDVKTDVRAQMQFKTSRIDGLMQECRAKGVVIAQRSEALRAFENYYCSMKDAFDANFDMLLSDQRSIFGTHAHACGICRSLLRRCFAERLKEMPLALTVEDVTTTLDFLAESDVYGAGKMLDRRFSSVHDAFEAALRYFSRAEQYTGPLPDTFGDVNFMLNGMLIKTVKRKEVACTDEAWRARFNASVLNGLVALFSFPYQRRVNQVWNVVQGEVMVTQCKLHAKMKDMLRSISDGSRVINASIGVT